MTSAEILELLQHRHLRPEWAFLPELRGGAGYGRAGCEQFIDAWAINCYASKQWRRVAYEIKVSTSDYSRELRQPLKRRMAMLLSNLFYFVAPDGIIKAESVPLGCGLLEARFVHPSGKLCLRETVPAPWRDVGPPPWYFVAGLARRMLKQEAAEAVGGE